MQIYQPSTGASRISSINWQFHLRIGGSFGGFLHLRGGETPRCQGVWKWVQICAENGIKLEWEKKRIRQNPNKMWFKYSSIYFRTVKIIQPKQC